MRHHSHNRTFEFVKKPESFNLFSDIDLLKYSLGATLYMPGTQRITDKILQGEFVDVKSIVLCFEDAIEESNLSEAESNVLYYLKVIGDAVHSGSLSVDDVPLTFVRVRNLQQFRNFVLKLDKTTVSVLSGFVFPKFYSNNAEQYLECLGELRRKYGNHLYGMPILEGKAIAYQETRRGELQLLRNILIPFEESILNIRVGGTDFSALFGVRRGINYSIYDIVTVRDCLSDILNFFNRTSNKFLVSGPVWEYFLAYKDDDLLTIDKDGFHQSILNRKEIVNEAIDGLLREVILDKANGFVGKTIIHPSHSRFVNTLQAVTNEEYEDANQIMNTSGGVIKSRNSNKMNEINPHRSWASKIIQRARAFGVIDNDLSYLQLLSTDS